ncbi:MAG: hypothetical protein HC834_06970, partial [Rhodospirillales bacterium]|nr:hypothetical protein [Rhodospirillales bacterium]
DDALFHALDRVPDIVRGIDAVAVALDLPRGCGVWDANRGFLALLKGTPLDGELGDVRDVFASPVFEGLLTRMPDPVEGVIYRGVISLRDAAGRLTPLRGTILAHDEDLLMVAEHDIGEVMTLRSKLIAAVDELDECEKEIRTPDPGCGNGKGPRHRGNARSGRTSRRAYPRSNIPPTPITSALSPSIAVLWVSGACGRPS